MHIVPEKIDPKNNKRIPSKFTFISALILFIIYFSIEPLLSFFPNITSIISFLINFSTVMFLILLFIIINKFYERNSDEKLGNDNRFLAISFMVVILLGMLSFNRKAMNESNNLAELITHSIVPYELKIKNNDNSIPKTLFICIDLSKSTEDKIVNSKIPEWFKKEQKSKEIFTTLNIKEGFASIIDNKVTKFDLMRMKTLIFLRYLLNKTERKIKILTFGGVANNMNDNYNILEISTRKNINRLAKEIVNLKNDKDYTDFYQLFSKISLEVTNEDIKNHNILILSDFIQDANSNRTNKKLKEEKRIQVEKAFKKLTKYKVVFNFNHFDNRDIKKNEIIKFAIEDLKKKEIYASAKDMDFPSVEFIDNQISDHNFLFYYYKDHGSANVSCKEIITDDNLKLWINHEDISQLEKFEYSKTGVNEENDRLKVLHSNEDTISFSNNDRIKLERNHYIPLPYYSKQLYLNIISKKNNISYRSKIIFRKAMKKEHAKIFLSLTFFLFIWEIIYLIIDVFKAKAFGETLGIEN